MEVLIVLAIMAAAGYVGHQMKMAELKRMTGHLRIGRHRIRELPYDPNVIEGQVVRVETQEIVRPLSRRELDRIENEAYFRVRMQHRKAMDEIDGKRNIICR